MEVGMVPSTIMLRDVLLIPVTLVSVSLKILVPSGKPCTRGQTKCPLIFSSRAPPSHGGLLVPRDRKAE